MDINSLCQKVENQINPNWPSKYKIRRVYTALGQELAKNVDFFFSLEQKLAEKNMSLEDIKKVNDGEILEAYKVTCHSAALLLKRIYDDLKIPSQLLKAYQTAQYNIDNELVDISHWVLIVEDQDNKDVVYGETLVPDIPLIKQGMMTKQFIISKRGSLDYNNPHKEIDNETLAKARKELEEIDIATGYINTYYFTSKKAGTNLSYNDEALNLIKRAFSSNVFYKEMLIRDTLIYKRFTNFKGIDGNNINLLETKLTDIKEEDLNTLVSIVQVAVKDKVQEMVPNLNIEAIALDTLGYDEWLKQVCLLLTDAFPVKEELQPEVLNLKNNFTFKNWYKFYKKNSKQNCELLELLARLNTIKTLCTKENIVKSPNAGRTLYTALTFIASKYINKTYLPKNIEDLKYIPNDYIGYKFFKVFPYIFECNTKPTEFNKLGYFEQVTIIKKIIDVTFKELTPKNCSALVGYKDNYSPMENRIHILPVLNKQTNEYSIVFNIVSCENTNEEDYYFIYNIKQNTFETADILDIKLNHIIISDRLKSKIEEIEENAKFKL